MKEWIFTAPQDINVEGTLTFLAENYTAILNSVERLEKRLEKLENYTGDRKVIEKKDELKEAKEILSKHLEALSQDWKAHQTKIIDSFFQDVMDSLGRGIFEIDKRLKGEEHETI